ncbi:multisubunit sodium/proton antiporter, MrpC subunit [Natronincola peptidivorans]|uniref:Multisubunit sodium/proton antiporter, MrpC subunit n=1 Tax=Natronincola peptidivorans TaxID=426128 RepID=A0A1I0BIF9_9FIRM|nr:cation:proton antiporter subunit C [Natronincola peptidivorans]SET06711.1 multisubunit sodium/proton antiporter, MrpC subunit [Natronincola peptidivorans]
MSILKSIIEHINYVASAILFVIGLYTVLTHSNLLKKVIGINIIETSIFLFFVSVGYVTGGRAPIVEASGNHVYVNPLPSALILTGIVVAVSITAYALSLIIKLYEAYGTLDMDEIMEARSGQTNE